MNTALRCLMVALALMLVLAAIRPRWFMARVPPEQIAMPVHDESDGGFTDAQGDRYMLDKAKYFEATRHMTLWVTRQSDGRQFRYEYEVR